MCIVGKTSAGKPYVMDNLIAELKSRGYRVATLKHSTSDFNIDQEGKDS